ncbi:MAG: tetraacyldisaccharide 4'-kinase [Thermodesulfobacteriota bacterium]
MSEHLQMLFAVGRPLSPLYGLAMALRAWAYGKGLLPRQRLSVPVISVGNLTLGGTGKTPMTIHLARLLADRAPVIVSRGYDGRAKEKVNVVSDGVSLLLDARSAGDEPYYMAENLPGVPVLTSRKRSEGGRWAVERLGARSVILDDGFQHLPLARDVDLVLFGVESFLGNNRIFPGGDMREPLTALARAHAFILTGVNDANRQRFAAISRALTKKFPGIPIFSAEYRPLSLINVQGEELSLAQAREMTYFAFCGLAQPASFVRSLEQAGLRTRGFQAFRDHCRYLAPELEFLKKQLAGFSGDGLITTEKDLVKLREAQLPLPLYALRMELRPEADFDAFVLARLATVS